MDQCRVMAFSDALSLSLLLLPQLVHVSGQKVGGNEPLVVPTSGPLALFPNLITSDNFPLFPFTDQYSTGIELNPANKVAVSGDMNFPVPGWGNFDMDGNLYFGHINLDSKIGWQIHPVNHLNIQPETLVLLGQNPAFREARKKAKEVVVGRVPYGYEPIKCKPPYCNPFVHHDAVSYEFEVGDDTFFIGGENGAGVRFPLSGAVEQGTSPFAYAHGDAYSPVSVWDLKTLDDVNLKKAKKKALLRRKPSAVDKSIFYKKFLGKARPDD